MTAPRIALIHATPVAMQPIGDAFGQLWPTARITHLLEDSLSADVVAEGRLTRHMIERFVTLTRYAQGCGADAILFTCSAFGVAIEAAAASVPIPVLKPNEAMLEEALAAGKRIGLLATFEPSIPSLKTELEQIAQTKKIALEITTRAVPAALTALHAGCAADHDRLIADAAQEIGDCDALILGQFSMASAASVIPARPRRTVLTSPNSAVTRLKQLLAPGRGSAAAAAMRETTSQSSK
ncbi:MAG: aspartate/glutamate racemase family protein [Betaproteobacteria bacterium]|nr:aspartate/glutamate racemase family protein [Betaproteobacteria bacterium]MDH3436727.1 aspartate/glutamate racemase family protein [Betaproteobacteria bacterium]